MKDTIDFYKGALLVIAIALSAVFLPESSIFALIISGFLMVVLAVGAGKILHTLYKVHKGDISLSGIYQPQHETPSKRLIAYLFALVTALSLYKIHVTLGSVVAGLALSLQIFCFTTAHIVKFLTWMKKRKAQ